jgi:hypothetical protein
MEEICKPFDQYTTPEHHEGILKVWMDHLKPLRDLGHSVRYIDAKRASGITTTRRPECDRSIKAQNAFQLLLETNVADGVQGPSQAETRQHPPETSRKSLPQESNWEEEDLFMYQVRLGGASVWITNAWDALAYVLSVSLQDATVPESDEFYAAILVLFARWCTVLKRRGRLPKCIAITFLDHTQGDTSNTEDTLTKSHTQSLLLNAKSSSIETSGTLMDNCLDANARMTRLLTEKAVPDSRNPSVRLE